MGPQATESLPRRNQIPRAEEGVAGSSQGWAGGLWGGCGERGRWAKGIILEPECTSLPGRSPALGFGRSRHLSVPPFPSLSNGEK